MSNETKHTPGRFYAMKAGNDTQGLIVPEGDGPAIAVTYRAEDAPLLAAAPELLRGCMAALAYLADPPSKFAENRASAVEIIRAAIAAAKGEA